MNYGTHTAFADGTIECDIPGCVHRQPIPPCETPGCGLTRGHALSPPGRPCQVWTEPRPWKRVGYPSAAGVAAAHARWR